MAANRIAVAAALGEVAPTTSGTPATLYVERRSDVPEKAVVCALTATDGDGSGGGPARQSRSTPCPADDMFGRGADGRPADTLAAQRIGAVAGGPGRSRVVGGRLRRR